MTVLRVPSDAEEVFWGGVRAMLSSPDARLRMRGEAIFARLKTTRAGPGMPGQLSLWEGVVPWRVYPQTRFHCVALNCQNVTVEACVKRQVDSERQRTITGAKRGHQGGLRGQAPEYPACQTHLCAQGKSIREALDPTSRLDPAAGPQRGSPGFGLRRRLRASLGGATVAP